MTIRLGGRQTGFRVSEAISAYDPDAAAFFAKGVALGETALSTPIKSALNTYVLALKAAGNWRSNTANEVLFPYVGATATWHSLNLFAPDLHQITWSGTGTHDANGVTGNGVDFIGEIANLAGPDTTANSLALGTYNRTNSDAFVTEIGTGQVRSFARLSDTAIFDNAFNGGDGRASGANTDSRGLIVTSRTGAAVHKGFVNGVQVGATCTGAQGDLSTLAPNNFAVAGLVGLDPGVPGFPSDRNFCMSFVMAGRSDAQVLSLYNATQALQVALGRSV